MSEPTSAIRHYGTTDLVQRVSDALRDAGHGEGRLSLETLAPLDQFHFGGFAATQELARRLAIPKGSTLLDIGCGIGGSSRYLAATYGCSVTGFDLNAPFVALAKVLTERAGLTEHVAHFVADATQIPLESESFDFAWMQHVVMNIRDRKKLYAEIFRVLKPGGRFAMYDILAGDGGPIEFPVPWASNAADSYLATRAETKDVLEASGFSVLEWTDTTQAAFEWSRVTQPGLVENSPSVAPLSLKLIMGENFPAAVANLGRNLRENRAQILLAIAQRPSA